MNKIKRERIDEVIQDLQGTCKNLDDFVTDEEQDDDEFLRAIDDEIFCCETCGWWCEIGEQSDCEDSMVCEGCNEQKDD